MALVKRGKTWHSHFFVDRSAFANHLRQATGAWLRRRKKNDSGGEGR